MKNSNEKKQGECHTTTNICDSNIIVVSDYDNSTTQMKQITEVFPY